MRAFSRIKRLPPYVFNTTNELKMAPRHRGEDIIDMSIGNPDGATPQHIVDKPRIPEPYRALGALEFAKKILQDATVAVSPGIGFGEFVDGHLRFALHENEASTRQAVRGIKDMFRKDGLLVRAACPP